MGHQLAVIRSITETLWTNPWPSKNRNLLLLVSWPQDLSSPASCAQQFIGVRTVGQYTKWFSAPGMFFSERVIGLARNASKRFGTDRRNGRKFPRSIEFFSSFQWS